MVPFQYDVFAQYTFFKNLHLNANLFALGRSYYLDPKTLDFGRTKAAMDMNVGAQYNIGKNFAVWANANNLFNSKYQRWNNYASYGLNVLGGVMIKF
ncbi:TonB-dependent receptor [Chitinophaga sedimenti]|uniref:autotransporter outer membrane beta-barrel domain-containing protein n=1 Tax=Chitinophaga sedimenti TaxID=2033606 RepID=UPI002004E026|nr:autotransporter outer membrane beta-barrel domain-containing protein [Chitinophaga sedimenti]MCK7556670.1 TonB-dependent receptor [Chitinophaga sedimenti]